VQRTASALTLIALLAGKGFVDWLPAAQVNEDSRSYLSESWGIAIPGPVATDAAMIA
jgi:hypothetical protein